MLDYINLLAWEKTNIVIIHAGTNDLTNRVKTMNKMEKLVQYIRKNDKDKSIQTVFSGIIYRADGGLEKEINSTNDRSKSYCSGNGFIFVDNYALNESCLNNGKLLVNKKGTSMLANNIKSSLKDIYDRH